MELATHITQVLVALTLLLLVLHIPTPLVGHNILVLTIIIVVIILPHTLANIQDQHTMMDMEQVMDILITTNMAINIIILTTTIIQVAVAFQALVGL